MRAFTFSEHGKPMNWTQKYGLCREAGIKYMHSVEIYLTESLENKVRDNFHTVLIAKNMDGLRELNRMVSLSCDPEHFYYTNRLSFDEFIALSEHQRGDQIRFDPAVHLRGAGIIQRRGQRGAGELLGHRWYIECN